LFFLFEKIPLPLTCGYFVCFHGKPRVGQPNGKEESKAMEDRPSGNTENEPAEKVSVRVQEAEALEWKAAVAPYDRPALMFRPHKSALLVIDMQKVFLDPRGSSFIPTSQAAGERLVELMEVCRSAGVPVIFTRHIHQRASEDGGSLARWWTSLIVDGEWESELADLFLPRPGERVVTKCRYSAFEGTSLLMILRNLHIEDLLIGGVMSNLCCETTARDAFGKDFNVFFLADGTATGETELHLSTLKNIAYGFGRVIAVSEVVSFLQETAHPALKGRVSVF
jgi:nicotinamidase-related amidase